MAGVRGERGYRAGKVRGQIRDNLESQSFFLTVSGSALSLLDPFPESHPDAQALES